MIKNDVKSSEKARIRALKKYGILDTPPDSSFDEFTKLAAEFMKVPIAIISLVDTDRIWFKSSYGMEISQINREPGLCASAIMSNDFYEVEDALKDPDTLANPLVSGEFGLRFYAAYPLKTKEGYTLGTLSVIDKKPKKLNASEKDVLKSLATLIMDQVELSYTARITTFKHNKVMSIFAHDLKNPLAAINMSADILKKKKDDPDAIMKMYAHIKKASRKSLQLIRELLEFSELDFSETNLNLSNFNMGELLEEIVESNHIIADKKKQVLKLCIETDQDIFADEEKIKEVIDNLINNAVKYSPNEKLISVTLKEEDKHFILSVKDNGPGLTLTDKEKLFQRFSKLSAQPSGNEISTGLGLYIVKCLVEAHKGEVWAESEGKNQGATFTVRLPVSVIGDR